MLIPGVKGGAETLDSTLKVQCEETKEGMKVRINGYDKEKHIICLKVKDGE